MKAVTMRSPLATSYTCIERMETKRLANHLARMDANVSPQQVAGVVASLWEAIELALSPIIGRQGVAALYRRCLYIARQEFQWLAGVTTDDLASADFSTLQNVLGQQDSSAAIAAGSLLLDTLHELLAGLVGSSLTERLLRSVWANSSIRASTQDPGHD